MNNEILSKVINVRVLPFIKNKWKKHKNEKDALLWYVRKTIHEALTTDGMLQTIVAQYENQNEKENCNI